VLAPVLAALGLVLGFLPPMHAAHVAWLKIPLRYLVILCATALPEEILFRGLIQNWLMQTFGDGFRTLLAAGFIFGCSHLNNGPQPLPNWRYMILATLAGVVFGRVFQKSSSILSSASLHAAVDTVKYAFF
jgi:membrane protease YdiL (CAAX protease family)